MLSLVHRICTGILVVAALAAAQSSANADFTAAYQALASKDFDSAIAQFRTGLKQAPANLHARKDLAYTLLKTGENTAARDEFKAVYDANRADEQAALEYAFLAYETGQVSEAQNTFAAISHSGSLANRKTAQDALRNIDKQAAEEVAPKAFRSLQASSTADGEDHVAPIRAANLWAFFDSAYRMRADPEYLAQRWNDAGISLLFVASWHNMEHDSVNDAYLEQLIAACHRHAIIVYAWLELPYVSERFWADHPAWREKTGLDKDAQIGWRKLMNLQNADCSRATAQLVTDLLGRFDWDGVNLAELSFNPAGNPIDPARFTPLNDNVRSEFKELADFDPLLLFDSTSPHPNEKDRATFLHFRTIVESRLQAEWLKTIAAVQKTKPYLDVVLTSRDEHSDLMIETVAKQKIGVDLSVIDLNQSQLTNAVTSAAAQHLAIALYSENAIGRADLQGLAAAAAAAQVKGETGKLLQIDAAVQTRVEWPGMAALDGQPWPLRAGTYVIAPAGRHTISSSAAKPPVTIHSLNAEIQSATVSKTEVDIAYQSRARAAVTFDEAVGTIEVDGAPFWKASADPCSGSVMLPAGQHLVTFVAR